MLGTLSAMLGVSTDACAGPNFSSAKEPAATEAWVGRHRFTFSAGWMWRETRGVQLQTGARSSSLNLPRLFEESLALPPIGSADLLADRVYEDGWVGVDEGTPLDGATSAWGYHHASQISAGSLHYHATGLRRDLSSHRGTRALKNPDFDGEGSAPVIEIGWERDVSPTLTLGAKFQWSFLDFDGSHQQSNFSAWQQGRATALGYEDRYHLHGIIPPQAPYEGGGLGQGPLLDNQPASRTLTESSIGSEHAQFYNRVHQSFEVNLHTLSLGPTVSGQAGPVRFQASVGFALHITDWEAEQEETLYVRRNGGKARVYRQWRDQRHDTDFLPGFYLQGGVSWQVTSQVSLTGFGRYDWGERLEEKIGPSTLHFDPSGWSAGVMVGYSF